MELGRTAGLVVAIGLAAMPLAAQRMEFGLGVGVAMPLRNFRTGAKIGSGGEAMFKYQIGEHPVAIRLDATYLEFRGKATRSFVYPRTRVQGIGVSAEYDFDGGEESRWRGWAFGGFGGYFTEIDRGSPEIPPFGRTYVGLHFGIAGSYRMGLLNPFAELQYLTVFRSNAAVKAIPLLIGFRLGRRSDY
jgi:hypothetical protein